MCAASAVVAFANPAPLSGSSYRQIWTLITRSTSFGCMAKPRNPWRLGRIEGGGVSHVADSFCCQSLMGSDSVSHDLVSRRFLRQLHLAFNQMGYHIISRKSVNLEMGRPIEKSGGRMPRGEGFAGNKSDGTRYGLTPPTKGFFPTRHGERLRS